MILTLDLGNTNLYVGVYQDKNLIGEYRTDSDLSRSDDMYRILIKEFLFHSSIDINLIEGAILSSVIPSLTLVIKSAVEKLINKPCLVVSSALKSGLSIHIDNPKELGNDLVCDCVGAINNYSYPCLIVDCGTANKFLVIDKNKNFIGGVFTPGIRVGMKALINKAAQLSDVSFVTPKKIIGKNTLDSLNSGATYGNIAMIKELKKSMEKELGYHLDGILTGGNSFLIKDYLTDFIFDPYLVFKGLLAIYERNMNNDKQ